MESTKLFRKCGYRVRHKDNSNVIYDLKEKQSQYNSPETIIINKNS